MRAMQPADLFAGHPLAMAVFEKLRLALGSLGPLDIRTTRSQIAFRRAKSFAYLWRPGQYLSGRTSEVILSIALGRRVRSARFKEVVRPTKAHWLHHLELNRPDDIDEQVLAWLDEAASRAQR